MKSDERRVVVLTSDPLNPVMMRLFSALSSRYDLLVVTDVMLPDGFDFKFSIFVNEFRFWQKAFLTLYKHIDSPQEKDFIKRNKNRRFTKVINALFLLKRMLGGLGLLPRYSTLVYFLFSKLHVRKTNIFQESDICLCDANLRHMQRILPVVVEAQQVCSQLVSIVYSWDNTHYSTLNTFSDHYLVWNQQNLNELVAWHGIKQSKISKVGSLVHDYLRDTPIRTLLSASVDGEGVNGLTVLYAAVFPMSDVEMASQEVNFVIAVGEKCSQTIEGFKLLFRAYPSRGEVDVLAPLRSKQWATVHEHDNYISIPRLGNEKEEISFEYDKLPKVEQFLQSDCLLSAGSTYTLEYCYSRFPIFHIDAKVFERGEGYSQFLDRLQVYGHLDILSNKKCSINLPRSISELTSGLLELSNNDFQPYTAYLRSLTESDNGLQAAENIVSYLENIR